MGSGLTVHRHLFVTGTDTGVGKTVATAALAAAGPWRAAKLVATGVPPGTAAEDAELLARAGGHPPLVGPVFAPPLSPHRAAALAGRRLRRSELVRLARDWAAEGPLLLEGVGGWQVPLGWEFAVSDVAADLGWPVLVVAADLLGVLNHALLTVAAIRAAGLRPLGVVLNDAPGDGPEDAQARRWNLEDLRALLAPLPVARLARLPGLRRDALAAAGARLLAQLAEESVSPSTNASTTSGA